ncbi:MAG TPA: hypothetical protein VLM36_06850, partial [Sphingomicrobium sp.]|nr:hypothetical protein [Sphingomicrobium sp.]
SLTPNADPELGEGEHTIDRAGAAAKAIGVALQRLTDRDILPLSLGDLVRGGLPTAVDRQLGLAYGAGAVRALHAGEDGLMVMFEPPDLKTIPMVDALKRVRTVPAASELMQIARGLGIAFGD